MPTSVSRKPTFERHQGIQLSPLSHVAIYHRPLSSGNPSTMLSLVRLPPLPESLAEIVINAHPSECNVVGTYWDFLRERNIKCFIVRGQIIRRCCVRVLVSRVTTNSATYGFGAVPHRRCCRNLSHLFLNPHPALQLAVWALSWACSHKKSCAL